MCCRATPRWSRRSAAPGYVEGALPPRDRHVKGMESFLGDFLAGFLDGSGS